MNQSIGTVAGLPKAVGYMVVVLCPVGRRPSPNGGAFVVRFHPLRHTRRKHRCGAPSISTRGIFTPRDTLLQCLTPTLNWLPRGMGDT